MKKIIIVSIITLMSCGKDIKLNGVFDSLQRNCDDVQYIQELEDKIKHLEIELANTTKDCEIELDEHKHCKDRHED